MSEGLSVEHIAGEVYGVKFLYCTVTVINPLAPDFFFNFSTTAPLTSRCCILYIYSTNMHTEYFKHAAHSPFFFSLQNTVYFIMLPFLVPVLFTFYIQEPKKVALCNKWHFEEKKTESVQHV